MYLTFDKPEYLWYLISVPLLIFTHMAFIKYTKRKAIKFANFNALKRVTEERIFTKNYTILVIRMIILSCLILAIAGTTFWYKGLSNQNDFVIAIDSSSSMSAADLTPSRFIAAKDQAKLFIENLDSDSKVGLVSFSGAAFIEKLPTRNKLELKQTINDLELMRTGGTDIAGAIITSSNLLIPSTKGRSIILITDGSNTAGYFTRDPIQAGINYARDNSIIIYTIGLGTNSGPIGYLPEYYNVSSVYDENSLKKIANETGGVYYYASTTEGLANAYSAILSNSNQAYVDIELTNGLLVLALFLFFLEWGLINTKFRSIP